MCSESHAVQVIFFLIQGNGSILCSVGRKKVWYIYKGYLKVYSDLAIKRHEDKILNSQKLMVNLGFTVNPCIQWLYLLLFPNVIKNKVKWPITNAGVNSQQLFSYLEVAYH